MFGRDGGEVEREGRGVEVPLAAEGLLDALGAKVVRREPDGVGEDLGAEVLGAVLDETGSAKSSAASSKDTERQDALQDDAVQGASQPMLAVRAERETHKDPH